MIFLQGARNLKLRHCLLPITNRPLGCLDFRWLFVQLPLGLYAAIPLLYLSLAEYCIQVMVMGFRPKV